MKSRARGAARKVKSVARRTAKKFFKGMKSKTMKGKKDFTTKKSSKVFNRKGHYQKHAKGSRKMRRPYHKKGGCWAFASPGTCDRYGQPAPNT
jgi:hypothetical protein